MKRKVFFISGSILLVIVAFRFLSLQEAPSPLPSFPIPTRFDAPRPTRRVVPSSFSFSPFQKTVIGKTTASEAATLFALSKKQNPDGSTTLTLSSADPLTTDEIVIKNGIVIFEKTGTFTSKRGGLPKVSYFKQLFGEPQETIVGSQRYGQFATAYVFADYGFTLIGNSYADEVYEIQRFQPTTVEQYKIQFGSDINTAPPGPDR